jgi:2-methylcitrate dehydratase PrpD
VIEARDGFMQAFAFGRTDKARAVSLPPAVPFGITDCYIKPVSVLPAHPAGGRGADRLAQRRGIAGDEVQRIDVATYRIAAEHAETGWDDFASAQLSFAYLIGLGLRFRGIKVEHFREETRRDPRSAPSPASLA